MLPLVNQISFHVNEFESLLHIISPPAGESVASVVSERAGERAFTLSMSANQQFAQKASSRDFGTSRDLSISFTNSLGFTDAAGNVLVSLTEVFLLFVMYVV